MSSEKTIIEYRSLHAMGFEGYRATSDGFVQSCWDRSSNSNKITNTWHNVTQVRCKDGYIRVRIMMHGVSRHFSIHRLILEAFRGDCPEGMETRHLNGIRDDNRISNLEWGTPKSNYQDRVAHGTSNIGERNPNATLTNENVEEIRLLIKQGETPMKIAEKFGVTRSAIYKIKTGIRWSNR